MRPRASSTVSMAPSHRQKRAEHVMPVLGKKTLGVKLYADDGQFLMPNGHDLLASIRGISPSAHDKIVRQCIGANHEAVVPRRRQRRRQSPKNSLPVVLNLIGFAVHQPFGS